MYNAFVFGPSARDPCVTTGDVGSILCGWAGPVQAGLGSSNTLVSNELSLVAVREVRVEEWKRDLLLASFIDAGI